MTSAALIEKAEEAARDIAEAVGRDPGGRGLLSGAIETPARRLAISLSEARRAVLLTAFPTEASPVRRTALPAPRTSPRRWKNAVP